MSSGPNEASGEAVAAEVNLENLQEQRTAVGAGCGR